MKPKPMKNDEIQAIARSAVTEAIDFVDSEIGIERIKAQRYFNGEVDIGHEKGRSKVVSTKCRDVVRAVKPGLMRVFFSADKPVEFIPRKPEDVQAAEQATEYVTYKFNQCDGYKIIYDAFHDALIKKTGVVKVSWEEKERVEIDEYSGLTAEQFALVASDDNVEVLEHSEEEIDTPMGPMLTHDAKVSYKVADGDLCLDSIAPEDFFVNREATCIDDAYVVGNRNDDMRVGDLVAMGYDFNEVFEHAGRENSTYKDEADHERSGYDAYGSDEQKQDPSMMKVLTVEAFMRIDVDGTGIPTLHRLLLIGSNYHLLDHEPADFMPFAVFEVDAEPHTFFGRSLVDLILEDQDAATSMLRGILDNVALSNTPACDVIMDQVNMDSVLNNEVGAIRDVKSMDAIRWNNMPFTAGATLPALQYYDEQIENKTGVSRTSMGLDPDALQNTTAAGVNAMVEASNGHIELMARNLAEGGMRQLFKCMVKLVRQHTDAETMMRLNGQFVPVDPRSWNTDMDLMTNVGLGTGGEVEREMVLRETLQHQMSIWQAYGPQNGLVTMTQIRHTLADIQKLGGIHNAERYWIPVTPEYEQAVIEQAQQAQQANQPQDPNAGMAMAEIQKANVNAQASVTTKAMDLQYKAQKDAMDRQVDVRKFAANDDLARDQMDQDLIIKAAEILAQYGIAVDQEAIRQLQAAPREIAAQ